MFNGIMENWARDVVILHLVCVSVVPAAKTWTAFLCVMEGLGQHPLAQSRETFRDLLSQIDPVCFRRHGAVPASVCQILSHLFGGSTERVPHLDQAVACDQCRITTYNRCSFALLGSTQLLNVNVETLIYQQVRIRNVSLIMPFFHGFLIDWILSVHTTHSGHL